MRHLSRREMAKKLGIAVALVPTVMTITAPKAMAQASQADTPDSGGGNTNDGVDVGPPDALE